MPEPVGSEVTVAVAREIRRLRTSRGLSAQKLADRCAALGSDVTRGMLANLENGRRAIITVDELLAISTVLGVPPTALLPGPAASPTRDPDGPRGCH